MALLYTLLRHTSRPPLISILRSRPLILSCSHMQIEQCQLPSPNKFASRLLATQASGQQTKLELRSNTFFQEIDHIDPERWQLIYYNDFDEEYAAYESQWYIGGILLILFIGGIFCGLFWFVVFPSRIMAPKEQKSLATEYYEIPATIGATVFSIIWLLATRFRRVRVLRMYELKPGKKTVPPKGFTIFRNRPEGGELCIVWKSCIANSKPFYYTRKETRGACERTGVPALFLGNFKVRMRPFLVYKEYFEDPRDYKRVRTAG